MVKHVCSIFFYHCEVRNDERNGGVWPSGPPEVATEFLLFNHGSSPNSERWWGQWFQSSEHICYRILWKVCKCIYIYIIVFYTIYMYIWLIYVQIWLCRLERMCIYIYIYTHVSISICVCRYICVHLMCFSIFVHMQINIRLFVRASLCVSSQVGRTSPGSPVLLEAGQSVADWHLMPRVWRWKMLGNAELLFNFLMKLGCGWCELGFVAMFSRLFFFSFVYPYLQWMKHRLAVRMGHKTDSVFLFDHFSLVWTQEIF